MANPAAALLMYVVLPLWFAAGLADWWCHRRTDLEHTTGLKETVLHLAMFGELAVPLLACLIFDINALVFAIMIIAFIAHELTALWDVSLAVSQRWVSPIEQHIHSFLELMPFAAGLLVAIQNWPQLLALFGLGDEPPRFVLAFKDEPLPLTHIVAVLSAATIFGLLPYLEELWRAKQGRRAAAD
jgi:hypothetical protein